MITGSKSGATQDDDEAEDDGDRNGGDDFDDNDGASLFGSAADLGMGLGGYARGDAVSIRSIVKDRARGLFSAMQQKSGPQASREEGVIRLRKKSLVKWNEDCNFFLIFFNNLLLIY